MKPGEDDIEGLKRRLDERLAPTSGQFDKSQGAENDWEIGDCISQWFRPNFETFMVSYPRRTGASAQTVTAVLLCYHT